MGVGACVVGTDVGVFVVSVVDFADGRDVSVESCECGCVLGLCVHEAVSGSGDCVPRSR